MNFFNLPIEIICLIYSYDSTYKELYYNVIKDIYILPTYQTYDNHFNSYLFNISYNRGIYIYSLNYKTALKHAVESKLNKILPN